MTRYALFLPLMLAACGESAAPPAQPKATALRPGLYQVDSRVIALKNEDDGTPRVSFKSGDTGSAQVCIRSANKAGMPPEAVAGLVSPGCETTTLVLPSGRITGQLTCRPAGLGGDMAVSLAGTHEDVSYDVTGTVATYLPTSGDITATVRTEGRRIGDCPA